MSFLRPTFLRDFDLSWLTHSFGLVKSLSCHRLSSLFRTICLSSTQAAPCSPARTSPHRRKRPQALSPGNLPDEKPCPDVSTTRSLNTPSYIIGKPLNTSNTTVVPLVKNLTFHPLLLLSHLVFVVHRNTYLAPVLFVHPFQNK
jgi:hypothetical protein